MSAPIPEPDAAIAFARLRFFRNHWEMIPTEPTKRNPIPHPKHMPCDKMIWYFFFANDAPIRDSVSKKIPQWRHIRVPYEWTTRVASGAIRTAWEMESPPMNAYTSDEVLGK